MSALEHPPLDDRHRSETEPCLREGFLRLAKAAGERAARAAERARRAGLRLERLRTGQPYAHPDAGRPVSTPIRATLDHSLSYQVLIAVHEQAVRLCRERAERGNGDLEHFRERAAWHLAAAERARTARAAWVSAYRLPP
ncbi:hypothetical protein FXF51_04030 [Nonomuraea sp. PA05]|uniref:hypothetical protein n=1 Tax=Nonomuraea sp. PA05 TaxID=2604466 RepID=UPI0011D7F86F|nr:hypothetical protein [Nonomuraea sp. PA05]TYB70237.1 hypothetical protein FXF51_04030 [Nonomuraea sp. PA05]